MHAFPPPQGLYDGLHEHDACGVAFVATLTGQASHDIVAKAITALRSITNSTLNKEPKWRHTRPELTTGYRPRSY